MLSFKTLIMLLCCQVKKSNTLKDLTSIAGIFHVSRMLMLTKTEHGPYLRVIATPQGPTLVFKASYSFTALYFYLYQNV